MAVNVALFMPKRLISETVDSPIEYWKHWFLIISDKTRRFLRERSFESRTSFKGEGFFLFLNTDKIDLGKTTAATASGPAKAPRPTSSIPAIKRCFCFQSAFSNVSDGVCITVC